MFQCHIPHPSVWHASDIKVRPYPVIYSYVWVLHLNLTIYRLFSYWISPFQRAALSSDNSCWSSKQNFKSWQSKFCLPPSLLEGVGGGGVQRVILFSRCPSVCSYIRPCWFLSGEYLISTAYWQYWFWNIFKRKWGLTLHVNHVLRQTIHKKFQALFS